MYPQKFILRSWQLYFILLYVRGMFQTCYYEMLVRVLQLKWVCNFIDHPHPVSVINLLMEEDARQNRITKDE